MPDGVIGLDKIRMREKIDKLQALQTDLREQYKSSILMFADSSALSEGISATNMVEFDANYRHTGAMLDLLIGNTISYLQGILDTFIEADNAAAKGISGEGGAQNGAGKPQP